MLGDFQGLRFTLFVSLFFILFLIEGVVPARSWLDSRTSRFWFSTKLAAINNLVIKFLISIPFLQFIHYAQSRGWGLSHKINLTGVPLVVSTILLFDLLDAQKHMAFHRIKFMWRFHRAHHTDTHLDVFTALRYHPGEFVISAFLKAVWIGAWGPGVIGFVAFEIALNIASQFHHSNIKLPQNLEKQLSRIFVTPTYHALHHTIARDKGDQNFTTIFSIWDLLFGTRSEPIVANVNLQNLGTLQNNHLSLIEMLESPMRNDPEIGLGIEDMVKTKFDTIYHDLNQGTALLLDVRERNEIIENGFLPKAQFVSWTNVQKASPDWIKFLAEARGKKIYTYCAAGVRSMKTMNILKGMEYTAESIGGYNDYAPILNMTGTKAASGTFTEHPSQSRESKYSHTQHGQFL